MVEEDPAGIHVVALAGHVQGRQAVLGLGGYRSSALQHRVHHVLVAGPGGAVEGGQTVPGLGLEVGALVQQQPHHVTLAPLGRHVQRSDVVLKLEIVRFFMFNQSRVVRDERAQRMFL